MRRRPGLLVPCGVLVLLTAWACGGEKAEPAADATASADTAQPAADATRPSVGVPAEFAPSLGVDLSRMTRTPSGLYVEDLEEGQGLQARPGHVVSVHYTGWLPNGVKFDSSRDRGEPFSFQLGAHQVIPGWEEGVNGMRIGGERLLVIPPSLAYGQRGVPGTIPPSATLVFKVELLDIQM